ncbi:MAG: inorganic phosphate transporter [Bacteroidales bacterium]|jgi:phosphate/sulfate permease|nr:inorganic phosphate transporter [Bacteroidales bacterium]MCI1785797.1 inorganic phosphate transporter [Bacteroidales bacterium]
MDNIYLALVVFLFILAAFDLIVGVSNDAVNFLNSAIGAKIATFRTIIIVAAAGIFCGAVMSGGMMEIARHGVFRPEMFSLKELMYLFIAVMVSDIFLLNIFNTLGMPTSTTVSMVFELLGGAFALSLLKMVSDGGSQDISSYMNTGKALSMIMAIFVSVAVAFFFGALVQYISRLVFTFRYKSRMKWKIGIFGGLAATAIIYFMIIKGIRTFSFVSTGTVDFIDGHTLPIIIASFVFFSLLTQLLDHYKVNVLKLLVLMGTFALAMAFAGNDLVNFIGVPLAGYSSYTDFIANGSGNPSDYMMGALNAPAKTPTLFLTLAGCLMIYSLATSRKAYNVVKTSVDLSKQNEGDEMFGSSKIARMIVRTSKGIAKAFSESVPENMKKWIAGRFDNSVTEMNQGAAFDEIRATVNLVVASLLIALGTSLKLPLSTTYVTFMVAMGSSLSDKAWGRESAVFRITGVLSVIGGWFITAGAAFIICFFVALVMYFGGAVITVIIIMLTVFLLIRSNIRYREKQKKEKGDILFNKIMASDDKRETLGLLSEHMSQCQAEFLEYANETYLLITEGFVNEDLRSLQKAYDSMGKQRMELKNVRRKEMIALRRIDEGVAIEKSTWFHLGRNSCEDILYCLKRIYDSCEEHIDNNFVPLDKEQTKEFLPLRDTVLFLLKRTSKLIKSKYYGDIREVAVECGQLELCLDEARGKQMERMRSTKANITLAYVYLNILQESQEIVTALRHLMRAAEKFDETGDGSGFPDAAENKFQPSGSGNPG